MKQKASTIEKFTAYGVYANILATIALTAFTFIGDREIKEYEIQFPVKHAAYVNIMHSLDQIYEASQSPSTTRKDFEEKRRMLIGAFYAIDIFIATSETRNALWDKIQAAILLCQKIRSEDSSSVKFDKYSNLRNDIRTILLKVVYEET